jgi:hypothetical protein
MYEKTYTQFRDSHSPFHRIMYIRLVVRCHLRPIWPHVLPINLTYTYFEIFSATVLSDPILYILVTFHVTKFISIFIRLGSVCKESVQVRGFLWSFVTNLFFTASSSWPHAEPQVGGPPLVDCPRLLIQYICSYPPYLERVSSIRNLRTRHDVVRTDPPNMPCYGIW